MLNVDHAHGLARPALHHGATIPIQTGEEYLVRRSRDGSMKL